jgi:dolichol-phosphate mannosyltransferase
MPEQEASTAELRLPLSTRVRVGLRHPSNWLQLVRFGLVGASGYVVNLVVYALCVHALGIDYRISATLAFLAAVTNNFWWNRHWTFRATSRNAGFQAARFLLVSVAAFGLGLLLLQLLVVVAGLPKVPAQAIAVLVAMPLNFLGNRLWAFK